MLWKGFQRPKRVEVDTDTLTQTYGRFTAQPFERGFATTIGNALRRCLLSSIEGAAVTAINIEGVLQLPKFRKDRLPFVTTLEECPESVLDRALAEVAQSDYHVQQPLSLPIFS